jgi:hypothetical protein
MFVCLSVLYVLGPCNSWRHQTFHGTAIGPGEGRETLSTINGGGGWVKFHPDHDKMPFSRIFMKFREFATILRLSISEFQIFSLIVCVRYGSGHLSM